jgi:hypothetical protein
MSALMNPVRGVRDQMRRNGQTPRDHLAANKRSIVARQHEVSAAATRRQAEAAKENYKMKKFRNVPSRLMQGTERKVSVVAASTRRGGASSSPLQKTFLRKKSAQQRPSPSEVRESFAAMANAPSATDQRCFEDAPSPARDGGTLSDWAAKTSPKGVFTRPAIARYERTSSAAGAAKPSVPRRTETLAVARREQRDIIADNRDAARLMRPTSREGPATRTDASARRRVGGVSTKQGGARHQEYGQVPRYITKRRAENAAREQERRAAMPDPECPPGTVRMPEEERIAMLEALQKSAEQVKLQIHRLPLRIETIGQRRRKDALDEKAKEVEEAIAIFSKEKVFVAA